MFNIKDAATEYINSRFPKSSVEEKNKILNDWSTKVESSKKLVADFIVRVGPVTGKKILDAGCGNGGISIALALAGASPTAIEIEEDLYDIAKKHAETYKANIDLHLYDGTIMPFSDNYFDYAVSTSVLEHTTNPELYLAEILRVLRPDGILYLGFPNKVWPKETHTGIYFLTYLPAIMHDFILKIFKRNQLNENNLHFYGYFDLVEMINRKDDKYIFSINQEKGIHNNGIKGFIKKTLSFFGLHYKIFLPHILVLLKKVNK